MTQPRFKHDCDACEFKGHAHFMTRPCDVYICEDARAQRTVVCRFSDDGPDYSSGALFETTTLSSIDLFALSHGLELTEVERERFHKVCVRAIQLKRRDFNNFAPMTDEEENLLGNGDELYLNE